MDSKTNEAAESKKQRQGRNGDSQRDIFAFGAMQAYIETHPVLVGTVEGRERIAEISYLMADQMMVQRAKEAT